MGDGVKLGVVDGVLVFDGEGVVEVVGVGVCVGVGDTLGAAARENPEDVPG